MTTKHRLFVHHYLLTGNKYEAYARVYPHASGEALKSAARRLAARPEVVEFLKAEHTRFTEEALSRLYSGLIQQNLG